MASDREIKLRIRSVNGIGQLTKAMKMVASSQIRKVENLAKSGRPYAEKLRAVVEEISRRLGDLSHPLLAEREVHKVGVVIVGSDSGLCGSYNGNVFRVATQGLEQIPGGSPAKLILIGGKAISFFQRRGFKADLCLEDWEPEFATATKVADMCAEWFLKGEVDEVRCYYTEAVSTLKNEPRVFRLLPLSNPAAAESMKVGEVVPDRDGKEETSDFGDYIFEPSPETALEKILPSYLRIVVRQLLLESKCSELGSRLRAMTNATDNAEKLAAELTLQYYRIRQNNITTEIIEISSGADALNK